MYYSCKDLVGMRTRTYYIHIHISFTYIDFEF